MWTGKIGFWLLLTTNHGQTSFFFNILQIEKDIENTDKFNYKEHIFDFLYEQIQYLKSTIYRNELFEYEDVEEDYKKITK